MATLNGTDYRLGLTTRPGNESIISLGMPLGTPGPASEKSAALQSDPWLMSIGVDRIEGLVLTKSSCGAYPTKPAQHRKIKPRSWARVRLTAPAQRNSASRFSQEGDDRRG